MTITKNTIEFKRINNDSCGNPRYVCHLSNLLTHDEWMSYGLDNFNELYSLACKRANKLGGRKYHTKSYGGGIVFSSYNNEVLAEKINKLVNN